MRIDAHQHFWRLGNGYYGWLTPDLAPIHADFGPAELLPHMVDANVDGTVLVQAAADMRETEYLLGLAAEHGFIRGVVGWVDMESAECHAQLRRLAENPVFKGIRPMLQDLPDRGWMLKSELDQVFLTLTEIKLSFDALVKPEHLDNLAILVQRYDGLSFIVDHGAKPDIAGEGGKGDGFDAWADGMARLAAAPNVACKLSGLVTEARPGAALDDLAPYLDHLYDVFGSARLMWGSDWPVLLLKGSYAGWFHMFAGWAAGKSAEDRRNFFGATAARWYRIDTQPDAQTETPRGTRVQDGAR